MNIRSDPNRGATRAILLDFAVLPPLERGALGPGNLAVASEIIAPGYVRHDPGDPFPARGPEDVKRIVSLLRAMLPDFRIEVEDMISEGDLGKPLHCVGDRYPRLYG